MTPSRWVAGERMWCVVRYTFRLPFSEALCRLPALHNPPGGTLHECRAASSWSILGRLVPARPDRAATKSRRGVRRNGILRPRQARPLRPHARRASAKAGFVIASTIPPSWGHASFQDDPVAQSTVCNSSRSMLATGSKNACRSVFCGSRRIARRSHKAEVANSKTGNLPCPPGSRQIHTMVDHSGLCTLPGIRAWELQYLVHSRAAAYRGRNCSSICAVLSTLRCLGRFTAHRALGNSVKI